MPEYDNSNAAIEQSLADTAPEAEADYFPPETNNEVAASGRGRGALRELVETILLTLVIFFFVRNFVQNFRVEGSSMQPNFHDQQFLIVNRFAYCPGLHFDVPFLNIHWQKVWCVREPQRGDVVVFHAPDQPKDYIKRVVGLPGETIQIDSGQVLVDGQPIDEPYETQRYTRSAGTVALGDDVLFMLGDNRGNSRDSRTWGPLPIEEVVGKAVVSYWPPENWTVITSYLLSDFVR
jgi:signal peptidase I